MSSKFAAAEEAKGCAWMIIAAMFFVVITGVFFGGDPDLADALKCRAWPDFCM